MEVVHLVPEVDYAYVAAAALTGCVGPEELGDHLSRAWAETYRSQIPHAFLLEFDSDGARFLFDLASAAGASRADRTVAALGRSRPAPRPRDESYQRGYPSPRSRATRPLDKGHMVAHAAGGTFGPNMFPQDRERHRASVTSTLGQVMCRTFLAGTRQHKQGRRAGRGRAASRGGAGWSPRS